MAIRIGNIRTYKPKTNEIAIKVDRSNKILGNKFIMRNESQRDKVCDQYDIWIHNEIKNNNTDVINSLLNIKELAQNNDVVLLCWCAPKRCHAETIKKLGGNSIVSLVFSITILCTFFPLPTTWLFISLLQF